MKAYKINNSKQHQSKSTKRQSAGKLKLVSKGSAAANTALDVYLQSLAPSGRKSMRSLLSTVSRILMTEQPGVVVWHKINYEMIQRVRAILVEQGRSVNTINLTLAGIRGVGKVAMNLGLMDSETLTRLQAIKRVKGHTLPKGRSISMQEITAMVEYCNRRGSGARGARDKCILLVGCYAGLRCAELTNLSVSDFDPASGVLRILHGKGNKQREIYLSSSVVEALKIWVRYLPENDGGLMFRRIDKSNNVGRGGLSGWGVATILRVLQESAGITCFSPHNMRRTFITTLLEKNVDINSIRKLAGHSDITTTAKYDRRDGRELMLASRNIHKK